MMKILRVESELRVILRRFLLFGTVFVVCSGAIGSWLVPTRLLYGYGFFVYANLGKMVLVFTILFGLLIRTRLELLCKLPRPAYQHWLLVGSLAATLGFFPFATYVLQYPATSAPPIYVFLLHLQVIVVPLSLILGIYGWGFVRGFMRSFTKELLVCVGIALVMDVLIFQVWKLWQIFSAGVLQAVKLLLSLSFSNVSHIKPNLLAVNGFAVEIEKACSGLDSLFLFTALYVMVGFLDRSRINVLKFLYAYIPAALGMYVVNILRVYILMLIGILISPKLAISLFHTYAGTVLFILYFGAFWNLMYKRLLK
jgi:exosortase/archaeosortase family protein